MQETIQNLFANNPYFAFAGFVALVAICLYIIKKLKNIIFGIIISIIILTVYLYRIDVISSDTIMAILKIRSTEDAKMLYRNFMDTQSEKIKNEAKKRIIESLEEDLSKESPSKPEDKPTDK